MASRVTGKCRGKGVEGKVGGNVSLKGFCFQIGVNPAHGGGLGHRQGRDRDVSQGSGHAGPLQAPGAETAEWRQEELHRSQQHKHKG